jgi:hypothetical protein
LIIVYTENPLAQKILIDEKEREILRLKIRVEDLEDKLCSISNILDSKKSEYEKLTESRQECNIFDSADKEKEYNAFIEKRLQEYDRELTREHGGDCTSIPCSCMKCHAENFLGVDSLGEISNSSAYRILDAFNERSGNCKTCEEAIIYLKEHPPLVNSEYAAHRERWIADHQKAIEYLEKYQKEKLS